MEETQATPQAPAAPPAVAGSAPPPLPPLPPPLPPQPYPPPYATYYPAYPYYPTIYPYAPAPPPPPRELTPRQLRTVQGFDASVFGWYVIGASLACGALVGAVAAAAMLPALSGDAILGHTQSSWLSGVMVGRLLVWTMLIVAGLFALLGFSKFHEGRLEFGEAHERRYRELQATAALFTVIVGGAALMTFLLSNSVRITEGAINSADRVVELETLQDSLRLSALLWGGSCAASGVLLSHSFVKFLKPFVPEAMHRGLRVVPVIFLFVPILHAALSVSFVEIAAVDTDTWDASSIRAAAEAGGIAGVAAAVPIVVLVRALRAAHKRVVAGEVKSELIKRPA